MIFILVPEVASTQKSLSSSHDSGWNDPPQWAFTPMPGEPVAKTPTKRLNRRVAFPLNATASQGSNAEQPIAGFPGNLPPLPDQASHLTSAPHAPLLAPMGSMKSEKLSNVGIDKDQALLDTLDNFEAVMSKDHNSNGKTEEVRRRLDVMKTMWKEDKLMDGVCKKILEISEGQ